MKRYIVSGLLVLSSLGLSAQSMYDAYTFGATDYLGTARVVGLGGAVGAVGSDLGTIGGFVFTVRSFTFAEYGSHADFLCA